MNFIGPLNSGTTTGGAGASSSNASTSKIISGRVVAVYVKYNDSPPATTDVIVKTLGTSPSAPALSFLTLTNANTDGYFYPRVTPHGITGAALAALTILEPAPVHDYINVAVAQANDGDSVDIWLLVE